ncbi:MAG: hypothetical protein ABIF01_03270 [Candidatus Micrarchaeota archaeon]
MDLKIVTGALVLSFIAFMGIVSAMPNWQGGSGDNVGSDFGCGDSGHNRARFNNTMNCTGPRFNSTGNFTRPLGPRLNPGGNQAGPQFDSTKMDEFKQAIGSGDYQMAMQLHETYGFGGPLFDKLTETTFAKYSQIYNLQNELRQELGIEKHFGIGMGFEGFEMGHGPGFARGMRNNQDHRATKSVAK